MITFFIQSADSSVNNQPIRYLFYGTTLEMNLPNIKALKRVHFRSWLMTAEPKSLNKTNWEAIDSHVHNFQKLKNISLKAINFFSNKYKSNLFE